MGESSRSFLVGVLAILFSGLAFCFSSDSKIEVHQGQIKPESVAVLGDWSSAGVREGNAYAIESRVMSPRLNPVFPASDTYKIKFYYVLKGKKPRSSWFPEGRLDS